MLSRKALRTARSGSVHSKHNPCHSYPIYLRGNDSKLVVIATKWRRAGPPPVTISMPTPRYLRDFRDNSRTTVGRQALCQLLQTRMIVVINLMRPSIITWVSVAFPDATPRLRHEVCSHSRDLDGKKYIERIVIQAAGSAQENDFVSSIAVTWKAISHWF